MIADKKMELTEGSTYKIISIGARDKDLETEGIFKGFISIGVDETGLFMELSNNHGNMAGKIRSYEIEKEITGKGIQIQIPMQWIKDMDLEPGDSINLLRDEEDHLILIANKKAKAEVAEK